MKEIEVMARIKHTFLFNDTNYFGTNQEFVILCKSYKKTYAAHQRTFTFLIKVQTLYPIPII
jgi:hypothetical protein